MQSLKAEPLWLSPEDNKVAPWENIAQFYVDPKAFARLDELGFGGIDDWLDAPADDTQCKLWRAHITQLFLILQLVADLSAKPPAKKRKAKKPPPDALSDEEEQDAQSVEEEQEEEDGEAPLQDVIIVPVYAKESNAVASLRQNAAEPGVVNYTGVVGFMFHIILRGPARVEVKACIDKVLNTNRLMVRRDGGGSGRGGRGRSGGGSGNAALLAAVDAFHDQGDLKGNVCFFPDRRGKDNITMDWHRALRNAEDVLNVIVRPIYKCNLIDGNPRKVELIAKAFTTLTGGNEAPEYFGLGLRAHAPFRGDDRDSITFGAPGPGLVALRVEPATLDFRVRRRDYLTGCVRELNTCVCAAGLSNPSPPPQDAASASRDRRRRPAAQ